ncbi:MAG: hypothetical protein DWQ37_21610 [Planctomycetota bacterium]|nr:MAG: hypothetical protein DWQ37_21610 [Planctomycetota bacterium]
MISTQHIANENRYMDMIRQMLDASNGALDWLVISVDDAEVIGRLEGAMASVESAALLAVPEANWSHDEAALHESVAWALETALVAKLVVVGASTAEAGDVASARSAPGLTSSRFGRVLQSASEAARQRRQSQERFTQRASALLGLPKVQEQIEAKQLSFLALFYRDDSQTFAAYDPSTGTLVPLQGP